jgi:hypothetical protein
MDIRNSVWNFLCKVVTGIVKLARALKEALTLGDAPRNLGLTNQTVATVASAAVPIFLSPHSIEIAGATTKGALLSVLSPLSHYGPSAMGWIAFKVNLASSLVVGSAVATCLISLLLVGGIRLVLHLDKRFGVFSSFAEDLRAVVDWFKSIFARGFAYAP